MSVAPPAQPAQRALPRPGDNVGDRITAEDVRKASFHRGQTPVQRPPQEKKRQQRVGIRLSKRSRGQDVKSTQWLVPPHLMSSSMISLKSGDIKSKAEVKQIMKEPWHLKKAKLDNLKLSVLAELSDSSSSSDSSDSDSSDSDSTSSSSSDDENSSPYELYIPHGKQKITVQEKQSGVIGVHWSKVGHGAWLAVFCESGKRQSKRFPLSRYKTAENTWEYADAKALKEAIKYRQGKAKDGKNIMNGQCRRAPRISGVKGVNWCRRSGCWLARLIHQGKQHNLGWFYPLADTEDSVEEARMAAVAARQKAEAKYFQIELRNSSRQACQGGA